MTAKKAIRFTLEQVEDGMQNNDGFCIACGEITFSGVEQDACGYTCHACGRPQVEGAANILMMGLVD